MTEQQILTKLTALCARAEHCLQEMRMKLRRWEVDDATSRRVLDYLVKEHYVDEERYARCFIKDKLRYAGWGRYKIEQALRAKEIPREVYAPLLSEIASEHYEELLLPLLRRKLPTVRASDDYERRMKLIRFAMQRGFSYDEAQHCVALLLNEPLCK